jgi:hypothetical protein
MHPLDVVKTRFQVQSGANQQYSGILDCFRKTIKSEGFILSFRFFKILIASLMQNYFSISKISCHLQRNIAANNS